MKNKGLVIFLTIFITGLSLYYLSFTRKAQSIERDAIEQTLDENGHRNDVRKRAYLDSIYRTPVNTIFGEYTYEEIKKKELSLGLDLKGGMHVTLEVSPIEIIKGLSNNSKNANFLKALDAAKEKQKDSQEEFVDLFAESYQELAGVDKLAKVFATASNRGTLSSKSSDDEVLSLIKKEVDDAIVRSENIIRNRIDEFGTSQPSIQRIKGTGRIQVEIPGAEDTKRIRKLLQGIAKLEFLHVATPDKYVSTLVAINAKLVEEMKASGEISTTDDLVEETADEAKDELTDLIEEDSTANEIEGDLTDLIEEDSMVSDSTASKKAPVDSLAVARQDSIKNAQNNPLFQVLQIDQQTYTMYVAISDTSKVNGYFKRPAVKELIPKTIKFAYDFKPVDPQEGEVAKYVQLYAVEIPRAGTELTGETVTKARSDFDTQNKGEPVVSMTMNTKGARLWKKMTKRAYEEKGRIAIILDNKVLSAPGVTNGPIDGGRTQISGSFTIQETIDFANMLKAGKLPAPTRIVAESVIGPTLGAESQKAGIYSIVVGLLLVVIFMVIYYAKSGLIANVALIFNIFFILGVLANLGASLTLPGIAGIVLTIGMSIDANVLIFERVREELRNGVGLLKAIQDGYKSAFSSILDANVTTLLIGVILAYFGEGPVKGFAVTLIIGIVCSFFTAVYITRVIVEWLSKKGDESRISFSTPLSKNILTNISYDFMSRRRIAYGISGLVILIGLSVLFSKGLNYGVDFKGGRSYVIEFPIKVSPERVESALKDQYPKAGIQAKTFGSATKVKVTTTYKVEEESTAADQEVMQLLIEGLNKELSSEGIAYSNKDGLPTSTIYKIPSTEKVGATIADDIKTSSIEAGILALIVIFLYILARFGNYRYSAGAVVALMHDSIIVISSFSIASLFGLTYEVDQVFVAAILTIIGYSINDTVVVFDRIRETTEARGENNLKDMVNISINNTISRTMVTSLTTFIVVFVLFLFGGPALKGFSFALLVGIIVGTYSSIFVASPLVVDLHKAKKSKKVA